jgi:hypothetical protein
MEYNSTTKSKDGAEGKQQKRKRIRKNTDIDDDME